MANHLKMAKIHAIQVLRGQGWSFRRIARELDIHRDTARRYVDLERAAAECGPLPVGSDGENRPNLPAGSSDFGELSRAGPASRCEPFRDIVIGALEQGLSAQRIWQDLRADHGFEGGYDSVKRFVRRLGATTPLPFRRMECEPGAEAQVDFGTGAPVVIPEGEVLPLGVKTLDARRDSVAREREAFAACQGKTRRRKTHIFRIVLSHSRKAYSEVVHRQTADNFIRCIENAFLHFGGVPRTLVVDNLKAAVIRADWYDPDLNPKIRSFCEHYGTVILPTRPRMPRHKGKVERIVGYAQDNALKGRTFESLADQNRHLLEWETQVADTRIHGTTQKQVKKCFEGVERAALLPLPVDRFPCFEEGRRKVNRDGHVEVAKAYYSVPPEYLGRAVWVRWDSHVVRIFNHRFEQICIHARQEPGRFSTHDRHIHDRKRSGIERGTAYNLNRASLIGPHTGRWAEQMVHQRGIEGVRVLMGLLSLANRHPARAIERACEIACGHGAYRLRTLRELIKRQGDRQERFEFLDEHPIIRSMAEYGQLVHTAFEEQMA